MQRRNQLVAITSVLAVFFSGFMFAQQAVAATPAVIVLDPDDDIASIDWGSYGKPYGYVSELPLSIKLAQAVQTRLEDNCRANVVLTRDNPAQAVVSRTTRRQVADAANPDLMVTLAFNALTGAPWGIETDGGPRAYAPPQYAGFAAQFLNEVPAYTGRPSTVPVTTASIPPWYSEFGGTSYPYAHLETLFIDHNYDIEVIEDSAGFGYIADGVTAGIQDEMAAQGLTCLKYPARPSADELARLRNLGYQNFLRYGADPVSMSTGNFITSEATFDLSGVGSQAIDTTLNYNTQSGLDSPVGVGWSFAYGSYVQLFDDDSASVALADGRTFLYEPDGNGGYVSPDDAYATLTANGDTLTWTNTTGEVQTFQLDESTGRAALTSIKDRQGNTVHLTYDGDGQLFPELASITDEAGQRVTATTDDNGRVTSLTRPDGATWTLGYSGAGDLVSLTSPAGRMKSYGYDDAHRMTSETGADGVTWLRNTYDDQSRVIGQTTSMGYTRSLVFDDQAQTTTYTDANGAVTVYYWNDNKQVTKVIDALGGVTLTDYTDTALTASDTDPNGATTRYDYNAAGQLVTVTDPTGATQTMAYNATGDLVKTTDQGGANNAARTTSYEVDAAGLPTKTINPDGTSTTNVYDAHGDLTATTDELGQTTTIAYDGRGNTTSVTDPAGETTSYTYDLANRLTSQTDPLGNTTTYTYDADDNLVKVVCPNNSTESYTYDANDQVTKYVDRRGETTTYQHDTEMNLTATTAADGGVTRYEYDHENRLTATIDPLGGTTVYTLDALGRVTATTDGRGNTAKTGYDAAGNVLSQTDAAGFTTSYVRDARGLPTNVTDADGGVTTAVYDAVGRLVSVTDPVGAVTGYAYNWRDQTTTTTDPAGGTVTDIYDAAGQLASETNQRGAITAYGYDAAGRLTTQTDALGGVTKYGYDAVGQRTTVTDPNGHTATIAYDAMGNATSQTNALNQTTTYGYDKGGLTTSQTDPLGQTTTATYDAMGRLVSVTDPAGNVTRSGWDLMGNQTSKTSPDGTITRYTYDANANLTSVIENAVDGAPSAVDQNVTTTYTYDPRDLLATITDANKAVTAFEYGANGQVSKETDQIGRITAYMYDLAGNLATKTAADGVVTTYTWDNRANLIGRAYSTGTSDSFGYDEAGNQTSATNATGTVTTSYDLLNRVTSTTDAAKQTLAYTWDAVGNRTGLILPDGSKITYSYDAANQNTSITSPLGTVNTTYDAASRPVTTTRGDGTTVTIGYTAASQIASLTTAKGSSKLASFAYDYTANGYVASRTQTVGATKPETQTAKYTYDPLGRLTASTGSPIPSTYTYDAVGNRIQWTGSDDPDTAKPDDPFTQNNTYDAAGELTKSVKTRQNGGTTFTDTTVNTWSPTGNLVESVTTAQAPGQSSRTGYAYDEENRLIAVGPSIGATCNGANPGIGENGCPPGLNKPGTPASGADAKTTVTRTYDALGRVVTETANGQATTWTHDGLDPIYASSDTTSVYLRDVTGELLGQQAGKKGTVEWYVADMLGSIYTSTEAGALTKSQTGYTDYGRQLTDPLWPFGYSGERQIPDGNGLVGYYARAYEPDMATWVQADEYRGTAFMPTALGRYGFVGSDPMSMVDLYGYASSSVLCLMSVLLCSSPLIGLTGGSTPVKINLLAGPTPISGSSPIQDSTQKTTSPTYKVPQWVLPTADAAQQRGRNSRYSVSVGLGGTMMALYDYWASGKGGTVSLGWSQFAQNPRFVSYVKEHCGTKYSLCDIGAKDSIDFGLFDFGETLGQFSVINMGDGFYFVYDYYDFGYHNPLPRDPRQAVVNNVNNLISGYVNLLALLTPTANFNVMAYGHL